EEGGVGCPAGGARAIGGGPGPGGPRGDVGPIVAARPRLCDELSFETRRGPSLAYRAPASGCFARRMFGPPTGLQKGQLPAGRIRRRRGSGDRRLQFIDNDRSRFERRSLDRLPGWLRARPVGGPRLLSIGA